MADHKARESGYEVQERQEIEKRLRDEKRSRDKRGREPGPAEAGVETDTLTGDQEHICDITSAVIKTQSSRGGTLITIHSGRIDGVHYGMEGYLRNGRGTDGDSVLADFQVQYVDRSTCTAWVDLREADVDHVTAVINPAHGVPKVPVATGERTATIARVTLDGAMARIVISGGRNEGYTRGMKGYVADPDGAVVARFTLEQVNTRSCVATVALHPDVLQRSPRVVLTP